MRINRFTTWTLCVLVAHGLLACGDQTGGTTGNNHADAGIRVEQDTGPTDATSASDMDAPDGGSDVFTGECRTDLDCSDGLFCNGYERCFDGQCFDSPRPPCVDSAECTSDACDEDNDVCVFTPDDSQCAPGQTCDPKAGCYTPGACTQDSECQDGLVCNGQEVCRNGFCEPGTPLDCDDGVDCTDDSCDEGTGACQNVPNHTACLAAELCSITDGCVPRPPCTRNDDCDDGLFCNGTERCSHGNCVPGTPPDVPDTVSCTIDQCSEQLNMVVHTPDAARCSDGQFCNGAEVCDPVQGCGPGVPPVTSDGVSCTVDSCDEQNDFIKHEPDDTACDDGLFCNGAEVCHPVDGCKPGDPPMTNDGIGCTVDTCSEVNDEIVHVADDSLCDDGLFCNGTESCDPVLDCQAGTPPATDDGVDCTMDSCDESSDTVVHAPDDTACDDGAFCNGAEVCDPVQDCIAGTPPAVDDGVGCTADSCDEQNDVVVHSPDDTACDDGAYCNGAEVCDPTQDCVAGTPPDTDDADPCTADSCDEASDTIDHTPQSDGYVCSTTPRSVCLSGTCSQSVCGDDYLDTAAGEECDDGNTMAGDGCDANCKIEGGTCDPDGTWAVAQQIQYQCCSGSVSVNISSFNFSGDASTVTSSSSNPVDMTGATATCPSGNFDAQGQRSGGCIETYEVSGSFTGPDTWSGTYEIRFTGDAYQCSCFNGALGAPCINQTFNVTATRQ